MNLNELAVRITQLEGKKIAVNVAQTKEILRCLGVVLSELSIEEITKLVGRLIKRGLKK